MCLFHGREVICIRGSYLPLEKTQHIRKWTLGNVSNKQQSIILFKCKYVTSQLGQLQIYTDIHGRKFMVERDITQSPVLESTILAQRIIRACKVWTTSRYRILAEASEYTLGEQLQFSSPSEKVYWTYSVSQKYPEFSVGNGIHDFRLSHNPKKPSIQLESFWVVPDWNMDSLFVRAKVPSCL